MMSDLRSNGAFTIDAADEEDDSGPPQRQRRHGMAAMADERGGVSGAASMMSSSYLPLPLHLSVVLTRLVGWRPIFHRHVQVNIASVALGVVTSYADLGTTADRPISVTSGGGHGYIVLPATFATWKELFGAEGIRNPDVTSIGALDRVASGAFGPWVSMLPRFRVETLAVAPLVGTGVYSVDSDLGAVAHHHGCLASVGHEPRDLFVHVIGLVCPVHFYRSTFLGLISSYADFTEPPQFGNPGVPAAPACYTVSTIADELPTAQRRLTSPRRVLLRLTHPPLDPQNRYRMIGSGIYPVDSRSDLTSLAFHANVLGRDRETVIYVHDAAPRHTFLASSHRGFLSTSR